MKSCQIKQTTQLRGFGLGLIALLALGVAPSAQAATFEFITNGDFETGDFTGWTVIDSGSGSWTINDGTFDPAGPGGTIAPISGSFDAVSSQGGPGQHILAQTVISVPLDVQLAILSWDDIIRNHASVFSDPNQEWRMLIFDMNNVLVTEVFSTNPGDPLLSGPTSRSFDITAILQAFAGQQLVFSWEQQDNLFFFNATLDNASLLITVPEPGTLALLGVALVGFGLSRRRKRAA